MLRNSILTRDVLIPKGWHGPKECVFCGDDESISHLFSRCLVAKFIWRVVACSFGFTSRPLLVQLMIGLLCLLPPFEVLL